MKGVVGNLDREDEVCASLSPPFMRAHGGCRSVGRSVGPLSNFFLQKRKGGKPHSLADWLPPMFPGNCWSKSHSIGPDRRLLWLRPRLDGEFKLKPSQIWIAMACTTTYLVCYFFIPYAAFHHLSVCIRILLGKKLRIAWFDDALVL